MEDIDDPMSDDEIEERVKGTDDKANEGNVILLTLITIMIMIMINMINMINRTR